MVKLRMFSLFAEKITHDQLMHFSKLFSLILKQNYEIDVFLTGSALYSLFDRRTENIWKKLRKTAGISIIIDKSEARIMGIDHLCNYYASNISKSDSKEHLNENSKSNTTHFTFWNKLWKRTRAKDFGKKIGFLQMESPYFHRTSVFSVRSLKSALDLDLIPDLYLYLDGPTLSHSHQRPSEFENIGNSITEISSEIIKSGNTPNFLSCSRCSTARGYVKEEDEDGNFIPTNGIKSVQIASLNKIIDEFESRHMIFSTMSMTLAKFDGSLQSENISNSKPGLIVIITHDPYGTEWTFGGVSFALAASHHGIETKVVFMGDGLYSIAGEHQIEENDGIFNVQEVIFATEDDENISYHYFEDEFKERGLKLSPLLENINKIDFIKLAKMLMNSNEKSINRVIFF